MKICLIDAMDSLCNGGYLDLYSNRYIAPLWFSELCEENQTGFSPEDYHNFRKNSSRYLKTPVIRLIALCARSSLRMGVTYEQLQQWGMNKKEYWDIFYPPRTDDDERFCYGCSNAERAIIEKIDQYMLSIGKYNDYAQTEENELHEIVTEWMSEHNISLE